ncbi:MAG: hypothetical protein A3H91_10540 [Gammaproteobacteria bacterium RIFCSPLOWO2_02_FULL_61_13]|nr:MAG: hypothetical protein A3H91_10540 [Gammaproteobacteria bacterium RIFCSPLOWO2_02_FULL_61_13]
MKDIDNLCAELRISEPYLTDSGFTAVVMAQLPRSRELPLWEKNLILLGATALGSAIVATQIPAGSLASALMAMTSLPGVDLHIVLTLVAQKLPIILIASAAISYILPFGAILAARRGVL